VPLPDARHHQLYRLTDAKGVLLYVGISYSAIARLAQHKDGKAWWPDVAAVGITDLGEITRQEAEAMEREVIRAERPLHNVTHNGKTTSRPTATTRGDDGIVGYFLLAPDDDPLFPTHQGQIVGDIGGGVLLVQWFSWGWGEPTNLSLVPVTHLTATKWRLYRTEEAFHEAGESDMKRRDREARWRETEPPTPAGFKVISGKELLERAHHAAP
jgi:predicted GIY-YIG superfamily endonuclease